MKAVRLLEYKTPFSRDGVAIVDVPEPEITDPSDVIVKIGGAGVCRTDLHLVEQVWAENLGNPKLPYTLGHENAGWIEAVGSAVKGLSKGDPVIMHPIVTCGLCRACRTGYDGGCEAALFPGLDGTDGGDAEYLKTSVRSVIKLAPGTDPVPLAPFADAGITAYHAVKKAAPYLYPGSSVVVIGAGGGLGHFAVQLLKATTSARVIALDQGERRLDFARKLGADEAVATGADGGVAEILKLTDGRGADVIIDFVAEHGVPEQALRFLRPTQGGTYIVVGYGGVIAPTTLDMISKEINILGSYVGSYSELVELMELNRQGKVHIEAVKFPLEEAGHAFEELDAGHIFGRGVLVTA
jgi:D-arabinose 1-dehydrogenase-like Zn-dependent alcohol dehydrogenase